jgi:hypothetical protein
LGFVGHDHSPLLALVTRSYGQPARFVKGRVQDQLISSARGHTEQAVRHGAGEFIEALKGGDIGKASQQMSPELRQNLGEVVAMLPLPLSEGTIEAVETTGRFHDCTTARLHEQP